MQLFYAPDITPPAYRLSEDESRHCIRVLRLSEGDIIYLTDGKGDLHSAVIEDADHKGCVVRIAETIREYEKRGYSLTVAAAPTKNIERFEWFMEKATETGIDRIIPIECEHSERRVIKHERAERIITSAVKQSLKAYHPRLDGMTQLKEVITMPFDGKKFIAHCRPDSDRKFIGEVLYKGDDTLILIGPEGDFSNAEIEMALNNGFTEISLGQARLRTETAALSAVTIASFINNY